MLPAGRRLTPRDLALAAAANHPTLEVRRRPRVAVLATGDELVRPGEALRRRRRSSPPTITRSPALSRPAAANRSILASPATTWTRSRAASAALQEIKADVLVTLGGASVGDYDLVQRALVDAGLELGFWRIAMRPGKPLMQGRLGDMRVLGLPGNPVSAIVCATLFLGPLLRAMVGDPAAGADVSEAAVFGADVGPNDVRQDYLRATLRRDADGALLASPFASQDSSLVKLLAQANASSSARRMRRRPSAARLPDHQAGSARPSTRSSRADDVQRKLSKVRPAPVLEEIEALPGFPKPACRRSPGLKDARPSTRCGYAPAYRRAPRRDGDNGPHPPARCLRKMSPNPSARPWRRFPGLAAKLKCDGRRR